MVKKEQFLYEKLDTFSELGGLKREVPDFIIKNLNQKLPLRPYQVEAFSRFFYYLNNYPERKMPAHLLFNMATGSGKTMIMAGLILYLYNLGYRNFLFFVNSDNIIKKTKDNFLNNLSNKYLFNNKIDIENKEIKVNDVNNFEGVNIEDINICFTTIQQLHIDLNKEKENSITFEDFKQNKVVILSDEAHHGQVQTKQKELTEKPNWENTIIKVFNQHIDNILLEFTATLDLLHKDIETKYKDKIVYKYDLRHFRNDGYSKEVNILQADLERRERILLSILLNQYKQDIAGKHGLNIKPVILFKAQKTIEQSNENKELFHNLIENLSKEEIIKIKSRTDIKEIKKVFSFYEKENISIDILIKKLKINFAENKCLSVNEESEKEKYQLLINSLEDNDNQIRAIFAVQKLNEGWDVLNLFDIVRLYETRDAKGSKVGKTTIAEAQLIGRGARYFPFKTSEEQERFKRKYDKDLDNELRILEELHYHSLNESRYISEIKKALVEEGLMDEKTTEKELKLKEGFKKSPFFKNGIVYINKKVKKDYSKVKSFSDLGVKDKDFNFNLYSMKGKITRALTDENYDNLQIEKKTKTIKIGEIQKHIILNALARSEFFKFENIKKYIPNIKSISELLEDKSYLADIQIVFSGIKEDIDNISNKDKFLAIINVLNEIELKFKLNKKDYIGTSEFFPEKISKIFIDKIIKVEKDTKREDGQEEFLENKNWYVFNANYGTSEEKAFILLIDRLINENFKEKYDWIYVIRNELHFKLYNFDDGDAFAPDFVLFMRDKNGKKLVYQIFIEPKGQFLEETDKWKEQFLLSIQKRFNSNDLIKFIETTKYKLVGLPFYMEHRENEFKEALIKSLE
ncbi:DEAD/DEAH box helicase family protein [Candidatus Pacearchaeota archaeon]|nr:DEAD/DEAH box helicase family protein [Candidatus Pacearchaeota archaeon]